MPESDDRVQTLLDSTLFHEAKDDGWYRGDGLGFSFGHVAAVEELEDGRARVILKSGQELNVREDVEELCLLASARQSSENEWRRAQMKTWDLRKSTG